MAIVNFRDVASRRTIDRDRKENAALDYTGFERFDLDETEFSLDCEFAFLRYWKLVLEFVLIISMSISPSEL